MTRFNIDFYPEIECDACGDLGSYDVDGEYLCAKCMNSTFDTNVMYDEEENREEDQWYC